jgi:hypothetical protein
MSRRPRVLAAALLGLALSACAQGRPAPVAGGPGHPAVVVRQDVSRRYIEFIGPKMPYAKPFLGVPDTNYFALRSWLDRRTGAITHQLYVSESYFGPRRHWASARDQVGDPLPVAAIGSHEIACNPACSYSDDVAASLSDALLQKSRGGLAVTFIGEGGRQKTIVVPAALVEVELATVEAWRRRLGPARALSHLTESTASPAWRSASPGS